MTDQTCLCSSIGYADNCPQVFVQGGKTFHTIEKETKLKPRVYSCAEPEEIDMTPPVEGVKVRNVSRYAASVIDDTASDTFSYSTERIDPLRTNRYAPSYERKQTLDDRARARQVMTRSMSTADDIKQEYFLSMDKFRPAEIGDDNITEMQIGGYTLDLDVTREKIRELLPLPAVALPIIFKDEQLNFYHHFFQGLETEIGRLKLISLVSTAIYKTEEKQEFLPKIHEVLTVGHNATDTALQTFVKRIISSTFEADHTVSKESNVRVLSVVANIWGLPYLEPGMKCDDPELKMWIYLSYSHYQTLWFNAFKSSGIPDFALNGVQRRYETEELSSRAEVKRMQEAQRSAIVSTHLTEPELKVTPRMFDRELYDLERRWKHERHHHSSKKGHKKSSRPANEKSIGLLDFFGST